ncbi:MAG: lytic transglycosylase domain-containing protein [Clostridia bacterium]|nr:lytic transglycosylase domain-containing protein [Clostridia bacterium]
MHYAASRKRLITVLAIFLLLAVLSLTLAHLTDAHRRNRRENAVYSIVLTAANTYGVSPAMVLAVIRTESDFYQDALSSAGAVGLMQLLPQTFAYLREEKLNEDLTDNDLWKPQVNIRYGTYYLSYLFSRFGNWQVTLAAYNAGEGRVEQWLSDSTLSDGVNLFDIPYPETAHYVTVTLEAYREYLEKYNFKE